MQAHELKPGQWFTCMCVDFEADGVCIYRSSGRMGAIGKSTEVELLPPDTTYDWVRPEPIEAGDGWALLDWNQLILPGDEFTRYGRLWTRIGAEHYGRTVRDFLASGDVLAARRRVEPTDRGGQCGAFEPGMSLRAWLAGQALACRALHTEDDSFSDLAEMCVRAADSIIERLKR